MARLETLGGTITGSSSWINPDPGIPLAAYHSPLPVDPLKIWKTQPSVRKVVGFAAEQLSQLPWHAFERVGDTDRQRLQGSVLERVLRRPSRWTLGVMLLEQLVVDQLLYDRFCAIWTGDELLRLPPKMWTVKSDQLGRVTKIVLHTPPGQPDVDLTEAPLAINWGWGDINAGGVSPLYTLAEILDEARQSVKWRKRQWDEAPKFGGLLKHPGSFKDMKKRETFTVSWKAWMDGREGTPILEDGLEYERAPQLVPKDARDIEGRQLTDTEVAGVYHIPPELLGIRPGNFSNMQAFRSMLFGPVLGPLITRLEQAFNRISDVVEPGRDVYLECSREAAINGSLIEQAQVLQTMTGGPFMTRAEARARFNLPHLDNTDELITSLNVLVGGQASPTDSGSQNHAGADGPAQSFGSQGTEQPADGGAEPTTAAPKTSTAAELKTKFDALGIAFRSGVDPDNAAKVIGIDGLEFVPGARPVTIRVVGEDQPPVLAPDDPDEGET